MIDLKLDDTDISITNGDIQLTQSKKELLRQRMLITFRTITGEWFLNRDFGAFNKQLYESAGTNKAILDSYYKTLIISFEEVNSLDFFESSIDPSNRVYSFIFKVTTDEGTGNFAINILPPGVEINYPYFPTTLEAIGCTGGVDATYQNELYELLNIDLPSTIPWF